MSKVFYLFTSPSNIRGYDFFGLPFFICRSIPYISSLKEKSVGKPADGIIPGDRGKIGASWWSGPSARPLGTAEASFTSPSGGGRTPPAPATTGARRRAVGRAMTGPRNDSDPSETPGMFRCRGEHSDPEGHGCYCAPARGGHPGAEPSSKRSPPRRGNATEWTHSGSGSARQGGQNLLISAALQTAPPDDESKKQPES